MIITGGFVVSGYHEIVKNGIIKFGKQYKRFEKIHGSNVPIHINHPTKGISILYRPDVQFITKHRGRYIFEILDSELRDQNLIIADTILACLSPNTSKVFFIVPTEKDQDKVLDTVVTLVARLRTLGVSKKELPRIVAPFYVLRSEAKSPETVKKVLETSAKDRGIPI